MLAVGCGTNGEAVPYDTATKQSALPSPIAKTEILVAQKLPLSPYKGLAVVMPHTFHPYTDEVRALRQFGYFESVVGVSDLQGLVINNGLQDQVMTFDKWSGYQELFRAYKAYLIIRFACQEKDGIRYRLIVTRPDTLESVFVSEVLAWSNARLNLHVMLTLGSGMRKGDFCPVTEQDIRLLMNSLFRWVNENR